MKKIIMDGAGKSYWFDGRKLEEIGKIETMEPLWDNVIVSIGNDIYSCKDGEFSLLHENAGLIPIVSSDDTKQFYMQSGVLMFREKPETKPIRLSELFKQNWEKYLFASKGAPCFVLWDNNKNKHVESVYAVNDNKDVVKLEGNFRDFPEKGNFVWNCRYYETFPIKAGEYGLKILPWKLIYKTDYYLVLVAAGHCFALFADGTFRSLQDASAVVNTETADILTAEKTCWHLGVDFIEEIVSCQFHNESYVVCSSGNVCFTERIELGSAYIPPYEDSDTLYGIRDGHYTIVNSDQE